MQIYSKGSQSESDNDSGIDPNELQKIHAAIRDNDPFYFAKLPIEQFRKDNYTNCKTADDVLRQIAESKERRKISNEKYREEDKIKKFQDKQRNLKDLIKSARIPKIFSNIRATDFKITERNETTAKIAINSITKNNGLFIYGECGTGKTMLASIIANERAELLKPSAFMRAVDIFHELNPHFSQNKQETINKRNLVLTTPCLIVDDLGAEKPSDFTRATLFDIFDYRMNENLQTIITTNFNINELKTRLNTREELNLSEKIIRRIKALCQLVELNHF